MSNTYMILCIIGLVMIVVGSAYTITHFMPGLKKSWKYWASVVLIVGIGVVWFTKGLMPAIGLVAIIGAILGLVMFFTRKRGGAETGVSPTWAFVMIGIFLIIGLALFAPAWLDEGEPSRSGESVSNVPADYKPVIAELPTVRVEFPPIPAPEKVLDVKDLILNQPYLVSPGRPLRVKFGRSGAKTSYEGVGTMKLTYDFKSKSSEIGLVGRIMDSSGPKELKFSCDPGNDTYELISWEWMSGNPTVTFVAIKTGEKNPGNSKPGQRIVPVSR